MDTTPVEKMLAHKKKVVIIVVLLGILMILFAIFSRVDGFEITRLNIRSDNLSVNVDGSTLRAYNGAFFYKKNLTEESNYIVLGGGVKLPEITRALWAGDNGVLLNFDQSFISTAVEDVAAREGLSYDEKARSTWYFDFSDNTLRHIGNYILYSSAHYFDNKSGILYYLEADEGLSLHTLDTKTRQDSIVPISTTLDTINHIDKCYDSGKICLVGRPLDSPNNTEIYSISDKGKVNKEFSVDGELYPILGSPYGLILKNDDLIPGGGDGMIPEYRKGVFTNLRTNESRDIDKQFTPNGALYTTYGENGDRLVVTGDSNDAYTTVKPTLWGSSTQSSRLKYSNGDNFDSAIIIDSIPTKNAILLKTTEGQYDIFAPNGYIKEDFSVHSSDDAIKHVRTCTNRISDTRVRYDDEIKNITLHIPDDLNFSLNVSKITDCLSKKTDLLYGYDISLMSYDVKSGRVTSY